MIHDKAEELKIFLSVTDEAYRKIAAHPENILDVKDMIPEASGDEMLLNGAKHLAPIWLDQEGKWGRIRSEMWDRMADFLVSQNLIHGRDEHEYTNEFFAQI